MWWGRSQMATIVGLVAVLASTRRIWLESTWPRHHVTWWMWRPWPDPAQAEMTWVVLVMSFTVHVTSSGRWKFWVLWRAALLQVLFCAVYFAVHLQHYSGHTAVHLHFQAILVFSLSLRRDYVSRLSASTVVVDLFLVGSVNFVLCEFSVNLALVTCDSSVLCDRESLILILFTMSCVIIFCPTHLQGFIFWALGGPQTMNFRLQSVWHSSSFLWQLWKASIQPILVFY